MHWFCSKTLKWGIMIQFYQGNDYIFKWLYLDQKFWTFRWDGLTLIPAWISNYIHYKVWGEITYPFPNFNGATVEVWEWISNFIPHFSGHVISYPRWGQSMLTKRVPDVKELRAISKHNTDYKCCKSPVTLLHSIIIPKYDAYCSHFSVHCVVGVW